MSNNVKITIDSVGSAGERAFEIAITSAVESSFVGVRGELRQDMEDAAKVGVDTLKSNSPYRSGSGPRHYRSGWRYKMEEKDFNYSVVIHQSNKPSLTWLLQNGHNIIRWNRGHTEKRQVGYVSGIPHISRARDAVLAHLKSKGW
jgi:hypothetical protein